MEAGTSENDEWVGDPTGSWLLKTATKPVCCPAQVLLLGCAGQQRAGCQPSCFLKGGYMGACRAPRPIIRMPSSLTYEATEACGKRGASVTFPIV